MKKLPVGIIAGAACVCMACAAFYLSSGSVPEAPGNSGKVNTAMTSATNAEDNSWNSSHSASSPTIFPLRHADQSVADLADTSARLEAAANRMEQRLAQLEAQMKSAQLLPMNRKERSAEIDRVLLYVKELESEVEAQNAAIRNMAQSLGVPNYVESLSPWDAVQNPALSQYRPYFEAKIKRDMLRNYTKKEASKALGMQLTCS